MFVADWHASGTAVNAEIEQLTHGETVIVTGSESITQLLISVASKV